MPLAAEMRAATTVVGGGGQWAMGDGRWAMRIAAALRPCFRRVSAVGLRGRHAGQPAALGARAASGATARSSPGRRRASVAPRAAMNTSNAIQSP